MVRPTARALSDRDPATTHATRLLVRVASRDRDAFRALYLELGPRVKGYLARFVSQAGIAEELTQEVLLTAWKRAPQFDPARASAETWIFAIARNRVIDVLRRHKLATAEAFDPAWVPDAPEPTDRALDVRQTSERVRAALDALPEPQREVLRQVFYEARSYPEIADAEGLALGTVKSRARLAFERLRAALVGDEP